MYLKVPYHKVEGETNWATIEDVTAAIQEIAPAAGLTVDNYFNFPSVNFPDETPYAEYKRIEKALQDAGFEVS